MRKDGEWIPSPKLPVPGMIGCKREVKLRIGFLGDSITQGIGATPNSYLHWNARVAEVLGRDYSFWNLGIGYGRAHDAASDGIWLSKAKQMDLIVLCMGVNDLFQRRQPEILKKNANFVIKNVNFLILCFQIICAKLFLTRIPGKRDVREAERKELVWTLGKFVN